MAEVLKLEFMSEKRQGHGEDSPPLLVIDRNIYAVGVFDGMGGGGAATCTSEFGEEYTKAYVASRIVKDTLYNLITTAPDTISANNIKKQIETRFAREKQMYPAKSSALRGQIVREYPTTLAVTTVKESEKENCLTVTSYWAGDSRNYLWTPNSFYQISKDDLNGELDPLENLRNDAAMSNCVCADSPFTINAKVFTVKMPFIVFSATDGCFGYYPTPMHFNYIMQSCLNKSNSMEQWKTNLMEEFAKVAGDDFSMSLVVVGIFEFEELKQKFGKTGIVGFDTIRQLQAQTNVLSSILNEKKEALESAIQVGWNEYKSTYMKLLDSQGKTNPPQEKSEGETTSAATPDTDSNSGSQNSIQPPPYTNTQKEDQC